jgi:hypothetical protein
MHHATFYKAIKELLPADADLMAERLLIMLILAPKDAWDEVPPQVGPLPPPPFVAGLSA